MNRAALLRWVGVFLVFLALIALGVWAADTYSAARGLLQGLREVQGLVSADIGSAGVRSLDPAAVDGVIRGARKDVVTLKRNVGWLVPLVGRLGWVPRVGDLLATAPALLELGDTLTEAGVLLWDDAAPLLVGHQGGVSAMDLMPTAIASLSQGLDRKIALITRAEVAYDAIDPDVLPYRFQEPFAKLGEGLPLLGEGLSAVEIAPYLLGMGQPRTYLVLALNEDELRPGGGFISGVGELRVSDGRVMSLTFQDSYAADDFSQPYPEAPEPLQQLMGIELLLFRDSNWSPDFPTSARQAIALYRPGYDLPVDGVIGVDQRALRLLAEGIGPVTLPDQEEPIGPADVVAFVRDAWAPDDGLLNREWWSQRKGFMEALAKAYLARLESGKADLTALGQAAFEALETRHVQIYVEDPATAALLAKRGWDGSVLLSEGDYLLVSEANVGYNKASTSVSRKVSYAVDLREAEIVADVVLQYDHSSRPGAACDPSLRYDPTYVAMMDRCYWAYVRVFVPSGAVLTSASHHPIPADSMAMGRPWSGEAQVSTGVDLYAEFSQAFLLRRGAREELQFSYVLPSSVLEREADGSTTYCLLVQKQPGVVALDLDLSIWLPSGSEARVVHLEPEGALAAEEAAVDQQGVLRLEMVSETDVRVVVNYKQPEE
ncbi:MAG: DUF4012 domain-containing protein [Anaerolineae bacterium]